MVVKYGKDKHFASYSTGRLEHDHSQLAVIKDLVENGIFTIR